MQDLEFLYQVARENPCYRREFLHLVDLGEFQPYVKGISVGRRDADTPVTIIPDARSQENIEGLQSRIKVNPIAFYEEYLPHVDDFLSVVVDFGGYLAWEYFNHPAQVLEDAYRQAQGHYPQNQEKFRRSALFEAWTYQLRQEDLGKRTLSKELKEEIRDLMDCYLRDFLL